MATPAAVRTWEHQLLVYRTIWTSNVAGSFIQPLMYLLGMGLGVGALVDRGSGSGPALGGLTYFEFFAPAMIATTAMTIAVGEALWPVMAGFRWIRFFHAQAATPISPGDIATGVLLWHATKAGIAVTGVASVLLLFDGTRTWGIIPAVLFGVLTGAAFAAPIGAWAASRETDEPFSLLMRFVVVPLFLFAGAFYPISALPDWIEPVAKITPLWHGVELCRGAVHGTLMPGPTAVHIGYLAALIAVGALLGRRQFARKLGA